MSTEFKVAETAKRLSVDCLGEEVSSMPSIIGSEGAALGVASKAVGSGRG